MIRANRSRGFVMVAVMAALLVVASVALMLHTESSVETTNTGRLLEAAEARYVAQGAIEHARWQLSQNACRGDFTIPSATLGGGSYTAAVTGVGSSTTYTLSVDQDAWIRSDDTDKNNGGATDQHIRFEGGKIEQALYRFDLSGIPSGATVRSALARFYIESGKPHPEGPITVHQVTGNWTETGATWDTMNGRFDPEPIAMITAQDAGDTWVSINLTSQVQAWVNGQPNHGILFNSTAEGVHAEYTSKEGPSSERPELLVVVGPDSGPDVSIQATGNLTSGVARVYSRNETAIQHRSSWELTTGEGQGRDAAIREDQPTWNAGANEDIWVRNDSPGNERRGLLQFDLKTLPKGARVTRASLSLYQDDGGAAGGSVTIRRVDRDWEEGWETSGSGWGAQSTWQEARNNVNWTTAGGDAYPLAHGSTAISGGSTGWYEWDVTQLVDSWLSGEAGNRGLMLVADSPGTEVTFASSDDGDATLHPRLVVEYACDCAAACIAPQGSGRILMVVSSFFSPDPIDLEKRTLFESWGYNVDFIDDGTSQFWYDLGFAGNDMVYVSETADPGAVGNKLDGATIGVVNAQSGLNGQLGLAAGASAPVGEAFSVTDNSHFITSRFPAGSLNIYDAPMEGLATSGGIAPGAQRLAEWGSTAGLVAIDGGAELQGGGSAAGRRVMLPLGSNGNFNLAQVNNAGWLLVQRSIAWAMNMDAGSAGGVLMVVDKPNDLTSEEDAKKALFESWGYAVELIDEDASQGDFDTAFSMNDVVFVSIDVNDSDVDTKLSSATIGVVTEQAKVAESLGLAGSFNDSDETQIVVLNNAHYITETFATGPLTILDTTAKLTYMDTFAMSFDLRVLGLVGTNPGLVALDTDGQRFDGGTVPGRRALLPWGDNNMELGFLTADGLEIFKRTLAWAAGAGSTVSTQPLAHWDLDEGSGLTASDSVGANHGLLVSGPSWQSGPVNGALQFDGSNDYVRVPHSDALSLTQTFSFAAWINATVYGAAGWQTILAKDGPGLDTNFWFGAYDTELEFGFYNGGAWEYVGTTGLGLQADDWYHVAVSFDNPSDQVRFYVDGSLVHTGTMTAEPAAVKADLTIGTSIDGEFWPGMLDDVRIYDTVLEESEVAALAAMGADDSGDDGGGASAVSNVLLVVGDAVGLSDSDTDYFKSLTDLGYSITLLDDGEAQTAFDSAIGANDVAVVSQSVVWWSLSDKLTGAPIGVVNLLYDTVDDFGFSSNYGAYNNSTGFSSTDPIHEITSPYGGAAVATFGSPALMFTPGGTLAPGLASLGSPNGAPGDLDQPPPGLAALEAGAIRWDGQPAAARRVHVPFGQVNASDLTADGRDLLKRSIDWAGSGSSGACATTFGDDFQSGDYSGNTGGTHWTGDWIEVNESNGPISGDERVMNQGDSNYVLRVRDNDGGGEGAERTADLSPYTKASLTLTAWRSGLDNENDYVALLISSDGGSNWTEIDRFQGPGNDDQRNPLTVEHDISAYIASSTVVRLLTSPNMGNTDTVYFDDVLISTSGCAD